ncbi:MAG: hypothetical protein HUK03_06620 [Bacteroidaceae bacterium]|nr:hypothetical protein [Bacteroidaceae bacterium]
MRIVQTFWTANRGPIDSHFGWIHPEYNLMSWTLSCYSLRAHYDEVALYTDSAGKRLLIDLLGLPYTEVNVIYDDFPCLPHHWALSKVKTYSLQTKPFLHIDGDVYLPERVPREIEEAPLVAQNREIGTGYYRKMMDRILSFEKIHLPKMVRDGLEKESVASYNMGVFGGSDIDFIQRYCREVFHFMESNHMNDKSEPHSIVDCNVFFEQVLFAIMADSENRRVESVLGRAINDEGYTRKEFCDLDHFGTRSIYHVLGGHKRNECTVGMLERYMIRKFPEKYLQIIGLYPTRHVRMDKEKSMMDYLSPQQSLAQYEEFLQARRKQWQSLDVTDIFALDRMSATHVDYLDEKGGLTQDVRLRAHPYISVFDIPDKWNPWALQQVKERLKCESLFPLTMIAVKPVVKGNGLKEIPLLTMGLRIIRHLRQGELLMGELQDVIVDELCCGADCRWQIDTHVLHEALKLVQQGLVLACK